MPFVQLGHMDQSVFVDLLRRAVVEPAISGTIAQITTPSGRNVSADRKQRAAWFNGLSEEDRTNIEYAVSEAVHAATFGFCCVLDGARAITDDPHSGHLELRYVGGASDTLLASSAAEMPALPLHELL